MKIVLVSILLLLSLSQCTDNAIEPFSQVPIEIVPMVCEANDFDSLCQYKDEDQDEIICAVVIEELSCKPAED